MTYRVEIQAVRNTPWYAAHRGKRGSTFDTLDEALEAFDAAMAAAPRDATVRIIDEDGNLLRIGRA